METQPWLTEPLKRNPTFLQDHYWSDGMVRVSGRDFSGMVESACYQRGELSCLSCHSSGCLLAASVLLPGGFFLGGIFVHAGDPGLGILLVPLGAVALFVAVWLTARGTSALKSRPANPDVGGTKLNPIGKGKGGS